MFGVSNPRVDGLLMFLSFAISIVFEYFPKLSNWYNNLDDDKQKASMFFLILVLSVGSFGLSCINWIDWYTCNAIGVRDAIINFLLALSVNQATHKVAPSKEYFRKFGRKALELFRK